MNYSIENSNNNNNTEIILEKKDVQNNNNDFLITKKKRLIDMVNNLSKMEYLEIFNIFLEDNCQYSENKNGVFINLNNVKENTIDKIYNFINFIKHKKEDLLIHEEKIKVAKDNIKEINEKRCKYEDNDLDIDIDTYNSFYGLDSEDDEAKKPEYLVLSSDEDEDLENKISLKKKKVKYTGKKAKMIKSYKDNNQQTNNGKKGKSKDTDSD
jgi:hypothetical protein